MATFQQRGDTWRAIVRRRGHKALTKTFRNKAQAEAWARKIEREIDKGQSVARPKGTLGELFLKYAEEVSDHKEPGRWERIRLQRIDREIGEERLDGDLVGALMKWRDDRLKVVSPGSVRRELGLISSVFTHAHKEWRIPVQNPVKDMRRPPENKSRTRRISEIEQQKLLKVMEFDWDKPPTILKTYVPWVFLFALETGMRLGEILSLEWGQLAEKWVTLDKTKNGDSRSVPLSSTARKILAAMPKVGTTVFMIQPGTFDVYWRDVRPKGLHFHDTRATALSRLSKKFQPMELAKISGHRDLNMLLNVYYRPTPEELADRLD